jgi:heptosyltransferase I
VHALFVKLGAIGDIVHALPALAAVRNSRPDVKISWVVETRSAEILRGNPYIDRLIEIDTRSLRKGSVATDILPALKDQLRGLREEKFDIALDFQGLIKSAGVAKLSGAPVRWGFDKTNLREPAGRVFLTDRAPIPPQTHVIRKNIMLAQAAFGIPDPESVSYPMADDAKAIREAEAIAERAGGAFAILNPAGGWVTKLWRAADFGRLADIIAERSGLAPIITVAPSEADLANEVLAGSRSGRVMVVMPTLKGFYELARRCEVYVGGDTGPTHLAIAAGARVVGIFGPTEWWRNGSLNPDDVCVERTDIGCRVDCHRRTCGNWICMDIPAERVADAVAERLARG